jgi:hypothetical protein
VKGVKAKTMELALQTVVMGQFGRILVTRKSGEKVRQALLELLDKTPEPCVFQLDFGAVSIIDYSFADEAIVRVLVSALSKNHGEKFFTIINLNPDLSENVAVSLQQRGYGILAQENQVWKVVGVLKEHLAEVMILINQRRMVTARDVADHFCLAINTASNRLMDLYRAGFAYRSETTLAGGGKQYVYWSILP